MQGQQHDGNNVPSPYTKFCKGCSWICWLETNQGNFSEPRKQLELNSYKTMDQNFNYSGLRKMEAIDKAISGAAQDNFDL